MVLSVGRLPHAASTGKQMTASCVVHGDDFTFEGPREALRGAAAALEQVRLLKAHATLGPEASDDKKVSESGTTLGPRSSIVRG